MSATVTDVLDRTPYQAPEADLVKRGAEVEDKIFSVEGRIGVLRYNKRLVQGMLGVFGAAAVAYLGLSTESTLAILLTGIPAAIGFVASMALVIYSAIKRLHDLGKSGWFYLLGMVPLIGAIFTLYYSYAPGKEGDNQYGAQREATQSDKVMGVIGIALTAFITVAALIPSL